MKREQNALTQVTFYFSPFQNLFCFFFKYQCIIERINYRFSIEDIKKYNDAKTKDLQRWQNQEGWDDRQAQEGGDICILTADSCCMTDTNTAL